MPTKLRGAIHLFVQKLLSRGSDLWAHGGNVGWVVDSSHRRDLTPAALVESVAVIDHLEDVDVMGETVMERAGQAQWPKPPSKKRLDAEAKGRG